MRLAAKSRCAASSTRSRNVYAIKNYTGSLVTVAEATGLTSLDQTAAAFSIGVWVQVPAKTGLSGYIWMHSDNAGAARNGIGLYITNKGRVDFFAFSASSNSVTSPDYFLPLDVWVHLGVRYDGAFVTYFLNGAPAFRAAFTSAPTISGTRKTYVGYNATGFATLGAEVGDIRVFPALALPESSMTELMDPMSHVPGCKQRLFWRDEFRARGTGAVTILDESGTGNHMTSASTLANCAPCAPPDWQRILTPKRFRRQSALAAGGATNLRRRAVTAFFHG